MMIRQMGFMGYPLLVIAAVILGTAVWVTVGLIRGGADGPTRTGVNALLYWGGLAALLGMIGTLVGISVAASFIEGASQVSTSLIWGGMKVALSTSIFGFLQLTVAALLWLPLHAAHTRQQAAAGA